MNMLRKFTPMRLAFTRLLEDAGLKSSTKNRLVLEQLSERELLRVKGDEVVTFLQGLITNDMNHLQASSESFTSMYAMFLNKAGRVLYDSIIYKFPEPNTYLIECDKKVTKELCRHLQLFKIRRKIDIQLVDKDYCPWVIFDPDGFASDSFKSTEIIPSIYKTPDPRLKNLGMRLIAEPQTWTLMSKALEKNGNVCVTEPTRDCNYRLLRYLLGVGEGVIDIPPGKCFPLEANCDFLHGVSFQKGCYLGQELTARVFHTGVIRKRLMPVRFPIPPTLHLMNVETESGVNVGNVRGVCEKRALAVLRIQQALKETNLLVDGHPCYVETPNWWPTQLPTRASLRETR